jgi:K+-transporting ATPase ATPase C chain
LATTAVAKLLLPQQAGGSLIVQGQTVRGSRLIGQQFAGAYYFHPRPSATTGSKPDGSSVSQPYNAAASLGSNLGPTNAALIAAVQEKAQAYRQLNGLPPQAPVPVDAVTASASGLDPHISVANAQWQIARIAQTRQMPAAQLQGLVAQHTEGRLFGLLGEPRVNVLMLNLALDAAAQKVGESREQ